MRETLMVNATRHSAASGANANVVADAVRRAGRLVALLGVVLPLLLIGGLKFTQLEVEALRPLIGGTPWLAWLYPVLGEVGAAYLLGAVEVATALLLATSPWSPRAGVVGGALGGLTFLVTSSLLLALPVWEASLGGSPALGPAGQFLIKDVALLGISLVVLGESLANLSPLGAEHGG
jgi:reactive chlorine resistance protein C